MLNMQILKYTICRRDKNISREKALRNMAYMVLLKVNA
jgi:hypothetical protein